VVTIEELEGARWPDPSPSSTRLVRRCHELRRVPLQEFTTEDLRLMLAQQIAVPILLPMALDELAEDPLVEGDMYPGATCCARCFGFLASRGTVWSRCGPDLLTQSQSWPVAKTWSRCSAMRSAPSRGTEVSALLMDSGISGHLAGSGVWRRSG
jgi:hypothetical protein